MGKIPHLDVMMDNRDVGITSSVRTSQQGQGIGIGKRVLVQGDPAQGGFWGGCFSGHGWQGWNSTGGGEPEGKLEKKLGI